MQTNQPDILKDKKERNDFYIALTTIFLAGVFITQTSLITQGKAITQEAIYTADTATETDDLASDYVVEEKDIEIPDQSVIAPTVKEVNEPSPTYRTNKLAPKDHADLSKSTSTNISQAQDKMDDISSELQEEATEVIAEIKEVTQEVTQELNSETAVVNTEVAEAINNETAKIQEGASAVIEETRAVLSSALDKKDLSKKDCVIAVGLYKDASNVSKLSSRLESEGYSVFTKDLKRLTQVGVYISCDPTISKSVLSEIKEIYAKDAFIVEG